MADIVRDAPMGQLIRYITGNRVLLYPEERSDFVCPASYSHPDVAEKVQKLEHSPSTASEALSPAEDSADIEKKDLEEAEPEIPCEGPKVLNREELERIDTSKSHLHQDGNAGRTTTTSTLGRVHTTRETLHHAQTQADLEAAYTAAYEASLSKEPSRPIVPQRTSEGDILVDWYTTDDQENPQVRDFSKFHLMGYGVLVVC